MRTTLLMRRECWTDPLVKFPLEVEDLQGLQILREECNVVLHQRLAERLQDGCQLVTVLQIRLSVRHCARVEVLPLV